jgi:hypothetical protein
LNPFTLSPHLFPRRGHHLNVICPLFTYVLSEFGHLAASPTSVGFDGSRGLYIVVAALAETSLIAHAKTSSRTNGLSV